MKTLFQTTAALLGVLVLSACNNSYNAPAALTFDDTVHGDHGPITTPPIIGRYKVPAGTTPTGDTGYAVANTTRTNGSIVNGTAAQCGPANDYSKYSDACAHAAGLPAASQPYISPYTR
ncbi:hypothetical protein BFP70_06955 [Thioclava sp. SK-1]|uniref:hypothetical protein n=1 Tax=Thioclava sp. SK-1 TaxID=1889770 RepID=UPI0008247B58|nr:hypothetical protein [Thioclava sp. SK-1]OCX65870.1 hypothetical protein BFP70_06955 [Thioclava sp. SK-1]